jgi:hypothetical protein
MSSLVAANNPEVPEKHQMFNGTHGFSCWVLNNKKMKRTENRMISAEANAN